MINSLVHNGCEVSLHLVSEDIFVHPPPLNSDLPGEDKTLSGLVEIKCPSERTIQGVKVTLQGIQTLSFPDGGASTPSGHSLRWEEKIIMNKTVEILDDGTVSAHKHAKHTAKHSSKGKSKAKEVSQAVDERGRGRHRDENSSEPPSLPTSPTLASSSLLMTQSDSVNGSVVKGGGDSLDLQNSSAPVTTPPVAPIMSKHDGLHLEKGIHGFEFAFIIPATSAPYERFKNARVRYIVTATAIGAGRGRSNISTWQEVFIILHVQPDGGPTALDVQYQDVHEALGPMSVSLISASLTVGGTANLSVYHPDPPPGLSVHAIRVFMEQTIEMYSSVRKAWLKLPTEKLRLWEKGQMPYKGKQVDDAGLEASIWIADGEDLPGHPGRGAGNGPPSISPFGLPLNGSTSRSITPGEAVTPGASTPGSTQASGSNNSGYKIRSVVRLPDDQVIRPSTVRGCKTDIRVTHEIGVEVFFSRLSVLDTRDDSDSYGKPKVQVFSMRRSVCIPSCCCTYDIIHLPPYSFESPVNSRPPSPTGSYLPSSLPHSLAGSRKSSHADLEHWKATTPLNYTLPGAKRGSPNTSQPGSANISRPGSRDPSPTRHGFAHAFTSGRKSRNSSPERAAPIPVRKSGLHALTPSHPAPLQSPGVSSTPSALHRNSLNVGSPWAHSFFPSRTATSHQTCNCGRTTEELSEAEQRLLEGVPTAPGAWVDTHSEGDVPPPWFPPSRAGSPVQGWHIFASGNREGGRARGKLAEINTPYGSPH
ncbi:hypothetical protein K437DRAFT_268139 [Tilletiaria anomala UBC 951]|uniref:Arrestin-like N-terminal domain-containing protein n=1 Tax=Tilletiaria anomala (strain ATCC 24038 / CBS 436.72 / UBC 951) TaxID=1037660 RepID=A0A066VYD7_TILAU|nr:uncharacterized protein K437DRAFT_268139 [Tilletiaria anomala UBC 951]KDN46491.1 hypothetical protein K437DRAFT_268139 [Tilletiaria anomala UBC 951]